MNTCSFTIHVKNISACSKVIVKCVSCFHEHKEASSFNLHHSLLRLIITLRNLRDFAFRVSGICHFGLAKPRSADDANCIA